MIHLLLSVLLQAGGATTEVNPAEPVVPLRFHGFLPGHIQRAYHGGHNVDFRIYLTPQGGEPVWQERHPVAVRNGWIDVSLGGIHPIPLAVHEATFKFLGASVDGGREIYPRYAIVNVAFVSVQEAAAAAREMQAGRPEVAGVHELVEDFTQPAATWREALQQARAAGAELPDYQAWYRSLGTASESDLALRSGHYEWVLPWVYDPASHASLQRFFRGRFEGCDYMDLSPANRYPYRLAHRTSDDAKE